MNTVILNLMFHGRLNVSYSLNYYKPALKSTISQTLSFNGNVTLTKKMNHNIIPEVMILHG